MKRKIMAKSLFFTILLSFVCLTWTPRSQAATPEDIETSIQSGLEWLVGYVNSEVGYPSNPETAFLMLKLVDRARELGKDPFQNNPDEPDYYPYANEVILGFGFIFEDAIVFEEEVHWAWDDFHCTYDTAITMMAIGAAAKAGNYTVGNGPLTAKSYLEVLKMAVKFLAKDQLPDGGWGYGCGLVDDRSDNSNTGYAALGLAYAQDAGVAIPAAVLTGLDNFIDFIQCRETGMNYGGSGYESACDWVNILKTGNLLFEMALVGDTMTVPRAQDALAYIENHWNDPNGDPGWWQHRQAMYAMMKGLVAMDIEEITVGGSPVHWFDEVSTHLVTNQQEDGSWPFDMWSGPFLSTVWALLTLEKSVVIPNIPVSFDIHPTSCPNPFNTKAKGLMPAAILGTDAFDVTNVDPASLKLVLGEQEDDEGVLPVRWAWEDVATPYTDDVKCGCTTFGPDGYLDLILKFDNQEVAALLDGFEPDDVVPLSILGNLQEAFGGTPIRGRDCVVLKK